MKDEEKGPVRESCLKYTVLIIYDVSDNKRRSRLVKCLEQYAVRVQKTAFQGCLTKAQCKKMSKQAQRFIDAKTDSLRIYTESMEMNIQSWGKRAAMGEEVLIF